MYHQTDEEAGGTHANRVWKENTTIKYENGDNITYNAGANTRKGYCNKGFTLLTKHTI